MKTELIIIGAGPTGLMLACQCVSLGVDFVLVEKRAGTTTHSKAIGVHARTLEIYAQLGLADEAIARGAVAGKVELLAGGQVRGEFDLSRIGEGLSPYPFILSLEQSKNEQLLCKYLQEHGKDVCWNAELESFFANRKRRCGPNQRRRWCAANGGSALSGGLRRRQKHGAARAGFGV